MTVSINVRMVALGALSLGLAACGSHRQAGPPPRAQDRIAVPREPSFIAVPIDADIAALDRALDEAIPRELWTFDKAVDRCVAPQKVKLFGAKIPVTPKLGCRIVGTVTRGALRVHGEGQDIVVDVPISAHIGARKVGGVLNETATGTAMAHARIRLDIAGDWRPRARVQLAYDWTQAPGVDFLGQRITFTDQADAKLKPVVARLERDLPQVIARMNLRGEVEAAWRQAFTVLQLNDSNPPVWMRVTPQALQYGGYTVAGRKLRLNLGMKALTETFVGPRPADPVPAALPALERSVPRSALRFFLPVIADYRELEPVVTRALAKRSTRPFAVPGLGNVSARFDRITVYGSPGGRIAVGAHVEAMPEGSPSARTTGTIWLTAVPDNPVNSQSVSFRNLAVTGQTDGYGGDLLLRLANAPGLSEAIADSLTQHFQKDFAELLGKVRRAIVEKRTGDFVISATVDRVENGRITAAGEGLYLPVRASGAARIEYRPNR